MTRWFYSFRRKVAVLIFPDMAPPHAADEASLIATAAAQKSRDFISDLLFLTEALAAHRNWSMNTVSLRAAGKGTYLADLLAGKVGITLARRDRILQWFADHWPEDLEWPRDIPRPSKSKEAA
jgi:hypothetical protein